MLRALSVNFTALMGSNQVLYACEVILSSMKAKQLFQTVSAVLLIVKICLLFFKGCGQKIGDGVFPSYFLTVQICEQKSYKKNYIRVEFLVFFSHTSLSIKLQKNFL